jgi:phage FluMu protein Com
MQLRCSYCQTMFAISRDEMLSALQYVTEEDLLYYDAHCPKCRRANRVERAKLQRAYPNWQEVLKEKAKEAAKTEKEAAKALKQEQSAAEAASASPEASELQAKTKKTVKKA